MMKKMISLLLALLLAFGMTAAYAESEYAAVEYVQPDYDGNWYSFYNAFYMNLPKAWTVVDVDDESYDQGVRFEAKTDDTMFILMFNGADELNGVADVTTMADVLKAEGVPAELLLVNGIPCVRYTRDDIQSLMFFTEQGDAFELAFFPMDDEAMKQMSEQVQTTLMCDVSALGDVEIVNVEKGLKLSLGDAIMTVLRYFKIINAPAK